MHGPPSPSELRSDPRTPEDDGTSSRNSSGAHPIHHSQLLVGRRFTLPSPTLLRKNNTDDEPVQTQRLSENQDEDHGNIEFLLLAVGSDTCISHDPDAESRSERAQTTAQTGSEMGKAIPGTVSRFD